MGINLYEFKFANGFVDLTPKKEKERPSKKKKKEERKTLFLKTPWSPGTPLVEGSLGVKQTMAQTLPYPTWDRSWKVKVLNLLGSKTPLRNLLRSTNKSPSFGGRDRELS